MNSDLPPPRQLNDTRILDKNPAVTFRARPVYILFQFRFSDAPQSSGVLIFDSAWIPTSISRAYGSSIPPSNLLKARSVVGMERREMRIWTLLQYTRAGTGTYVADDVV
jgi:hypothetical protein